MGGTKSGRARDPNALPARIVDVVRHSQLPISVAEIAEQLGKTTAEINKRMSDLYKAGRLKRSDILRHGKVRDFDRDPEPTSTPVPNPVNDQYAGTDFLMSRRRSC